MRIHRSVLSGMLVAAAALGLMSLTAFALDPYDAPVISCVSSGENEITIKICGGAVTGAPAGVSIQWMERTLWEQYGWDDEYLCALSLSGQPSLQHPGASRWELGAGDCQDIIIGDINFDETGVGGDGCALDPLQCGTEYVFRSFAHAGRRYGRSNWSPDLFCSTLPCLPDGDDCTLTQGYWKTHGPGGCVTGNNENEWNVTIMTLGNVEYTDLQLCSIFGEPAGGNGLISLAHQLIAAKLNIAEGATECSAVHAAVVAADAMIGDLVVPPVGEGDLAPRETSSLTTTLDQFNNGILSGCTSHCTSLLGSQNDHLPVLELSWGKIKSTYK